MFFHDVFLKLSVNVIPNEFRNVCRLSILPCKWHKFARKRSCLWHIVSFRLNAVFFFFCEAAVFFFLPSQCDYFCLLVFQQSVSFGVPHQIIQ